MKNTTESTTDETRIFLRILGLDQRDYYHDKNTCKWANCAPTRSRVQSDVILLLIYRESLDFNNWYAALNASIIRSCSNPPTKLTRRQFIIPFGKSLIRKDFIRITQLENLPRDVQQMALRIIVLDRDVQISELGAVVVEKMVCRLYEIQRRKNQVDVFQMQLYHVSNALVKSNCLLQVPN